MYRDQPPESDPNALTQPMTTVHRVEPVPVPPPPRAPAAAQVVPVTPARGTPPPYVHRFGSVPSHLFGRSAAFLIDGFGVAFVLATFGFHAFERGFFMLAARNPSGYLSLVSLALGAAILFAFLCEVLFGTTLGKLVFGLQVRRGNGRHAGPGRIFVRTLLRPIDLLFIGPLLVLVTPRHQRLGDFAGGTVVARSTLGWFASIIGLALVIALGYAQATFGGGVDSGIGVGAETADYAPGIITAAVVAAQALTSGAAATPHVNEATSAPAQPTNAPPPAP